MTPTDDSLAHGPVQRSGWGVVVSVLSKSGVQLINMAALVVLARLLVPGDFGLVAMVMAVVGIGHLFKDMGLSAATIRAPTLDHDQVNSLFWINSGLGVAVGCLVYLSAPLVAAMYQDERLLDVTRGCALLFVVTGVAAQPMALLRRQLRFGRLALISLSSAALGQAAGIAAALGGAGYWSLVAASLITMFAMMVLGLLFSAIEVRRPALRGELRPLLHFGGHMVGFSLLGFVALNAHNLILGLFHDAAHVGLYQSAFLMATLLFTQFAEPMTLVVTPVLSRLQHDSAAYVQHYLDNVALLAAYAAGLSAFLFICADDLVRLVLGTQWSESVPVLQLLALGLLPQALSHSSGWLFMSHGDTRAMMHWGLAGWGSLIVLLLLSAPGGTTAMASAYALGMLLLTIPCLAFATRRVELPVVRILRTAMPAFLSSLCAGVPTWLLMGALTEWSPLARLLVCTALFASLHLAMLTAVFRQGHILGQLVPHLQRGRSRTGSAP